MIGNPPPQWLSPPCTGSRLRTASSLRLPPAWLRRQPTDLPSARRLPHVLNSIVQSRGTALPEFHLRRDDAIPAPRRRQRNRPAGEFFQQLLLAIIQFLARFERFTLMRNPCPDLRPDRPAMKIRPA